MEQRVAAIVLAVNGESREFRGPGDTPLLWVLRESFGLKGAKFGCGTGACGACVVLVQGEPRHACTLPVSDAAGRAVTTIEGLAREPEQPVVQAWIAEQVPQCGYCQPAQLLTASWLLARHPDPSDAQIDDAMSHVLCRCGTYPRIRRAIHRAARGLEGQPKQRTGALGAAPAAVPVAGLMMNPWLRINRDGTVTLIVDRAEMGQGVITGLAMLVAEELEFDLERLRIEFAPPAPEYVNPLLGEQLTGGSTSIRAGWQSLRRAGAAARERFIAEAAERWDVPRSECRAERGEVVHHCSGRRAPYAALAAAAATRRGPRSPKLKPPSEWRLIGRAAPRLEVPDLALGRAVFTMDMTRPGAVEAVLARCPSFGGRMTSFDAADTLRVPGVLQVLEVEGAVAVVAETFPAALAGRNELRIKWDRSGACRVGSDEVREQLAAALTRRGVTARHHGSPERVLARAKRVVEATYETPYLAHATMEPPGCIAEFDGEVCSIWAGTQAPGRAQAAAMEIMGLPAEFVRVHTPYIGGGFGRRLRPDYVAEAVRLAKVLRRAVRVHWTREDDLHHDFYRPANLTELRGALDARGRVSAWLQRIAGPELSLGEVDIPYAVPHLREVQAKTDPGIPTGPWRSVGASQNAFAIECFVDELAAAAHEDPLEFRLGLLAHAPRHRAALELAAARAGWQDPLPKGWGRGIAVYHSYGSWAAQVAEVSIRDKAWRVERVVCAADCGALVNPDAAAAQMEGAIVFGLSAALRGEITFLDGVARQWGFDDYPLLRMRDTPPIEVHFVPSHLHPGGVGEPGVPPVAPAVANALHAASGRRLRRLPLLRA